jgi:pimeloyl-ACP methyl ester carboxylesterase
MCSGCVTTPKDRFLFRPAALCFFEGSKEFGLLPKIIASHERRLIFAPETKPWNRSMLTLPIPLLISFLIGLLSLAFLTGGLLFLYRAWRRYKVVRQRTLHHRRPEILSHPQTVTGQGRHVNDPAWSREALADRSVWTPLVAGLFLLLFTFAGRHVIELAFPAGKDEPKEIHSETVQELTQPDGTKIHAEVFGRPDAPTLVFTHGWSTSNTEWYYAKRHLSDQFRLIFWDLPGLGQSTQPENRNFALEKMASDLESVLSLAHGQPVVLVGHSIGGMINLTFCRLFPDRLGHQVAGIVQVDTSYTNPVLTTKNAGFSRAIQKPVGEPLLYAMIGLSPLVRAMNWLSYQNGTLQLMNAHSSFAGSETRGQLDLISRYGYRSSPEVVARGTLAMFHWDATPVLPHVNVPVLILVGQQDTTTLPSASEYMQQSMPQARLEKVSPSAHYGLLEQNQRYDSALARFAAACLKTNNP